MLLSFLHNQCIKWWFLLGPAISSTNANRPGKPFGPRNPCHADLHLTACFIPNREHLSPIMPRASSAHDEHFSPQSIQLVELLNFHREKSREEKQRYLIASSAQFPCLCVCVWLILFIHSVILGVFTMWIQIHCCFIVLENAVLCVRVCVCVNG